MKLEHIHLTKIDALLQETLEPAERDDVIRVIMILDSTNKNVKNYAEHVHNAIQHHSRQNYREYLIAKRLEKLDNEFGEAFDALQNLSLNFKKGTLAKAIVVEGTVGSILAALELQCISYVYSDKEIK
jgi:ATP-dependent Lon protease